ncbi:sensor histidine kinase [Olivibacter sp. CPCC 100613]|uniref:sensor histidine kinase n=1 Tax=Olivibacter sp. CPCC 100613 TaxID=3079931 RepID=UPI002FF76BA8
MASISFNVYSGLPAATLFKINLYGTLLLAGLYYTLVYGLYPYLIRRKSIAYSVLGLIMLFILYTIIDGYIEAFLLRNCTDCMALLERNNPNYYKFLQQPFSNVVFKRFMSLGLPIGIIFMLGLPISIKVGLAALRNAYAKAELIKEKAKLELDFLKSQFNPHFLFNALNNIYGLILRGSTTQSASMIAHLSAFLRYTIYEVNNEWMPIAEEATLIENYLELEKIRLNHTEISIDLKIENPSAQFPSLLLMPSVENAFKHTADVPGAFVHFVIHVNQEQLYFMEENTIDDSKENIYGGLGLQNLRKRLAFFYPDRYQYELNEQANRYQVTLICKL